MLEEIARVDADPYPASRFARALALKSPLPAGLKGLVGAASIALGAAAGAPASEAIELVRALHERGAPPFVRDGESGSLAIALFRASNAYALAGDAPGSIELLEASIVVEPRLGPAVNNLAFALMETGRFDADVLACAERAAALAPDDPSALDTLGVARYHQGRFRDDSAGPGAITLFRQALRLRPDDPSLATLDHLGDALWRDGDQAGALRAWQQIERVALLRYPPSRPRGS